MHYLNNPQLVSASVRLWLSYQCVAAVRGPGCGNEVQFCSQSHAVFRTFLLVSVISGMLLAFVSRER